MSSAGGVMVLVTKGATAPEAWAAMEADGSSGIDRWATSEADGAPQWADGRRQQVVKQPRWASASCLGRVGKRPTAGGVTRRSRVGSRMGTGRGRERKRQKENVSRPIQSIVWSRLVPYPRALVERSVSQPRPRQPPPPWATNFFEEPSISAVVLSPKSQGVGCNLF
jgi:hypothetical protein